jgi:hypothetical protein
MKNESDNLAEEPTDADSDGYTGLASQLADAFQRLEDYELSTMPLRLSAADEPIETETVES